MVIGIIIIAIIAILIITYICLYNKFVSLSQGVDSAWSQIDVQLERQADLIPNLVNTVKGYAGFEKNTLINVIKMRGQMVHIDAGKDSMDDKQKLMDLSHQLGSVLKSFVAVSERYPDLKANDDFKKLMDELTNTQNKIAYARQLYNQEVQQYNTGIQSFFGHIVAGSRFTARQYIKAPEEAKQTPKVDFSSMNN